MAAARCAGRALAARPGNPARFPARTLLQSCVRIRGHAAEVGGHGPKRSPALDRRSRARTAARAKRRAMRSGRRLHGASVRSTAAFQWCMIGRGWSEQSVLPIRDSESRAGMAH